MSTKAPRPSWPTECTDPTPSHLDLYGRERFNQLYACQPIPEGPPGAYVITFTRADLQQLHELAIHNRGSVQIGYFPATGKWTTEFSPK